MQKKNHKRAPKQEMKVAVMYEDWDALEHKGGRLNMCTALKNLKQEEIQEGIQEEIQEEIQEGKIEGMITAYRELNLPDDMIIQKLQK